jgi:hypothetical protein
MFCSTDQGIHQNEKVIGAVVFLLVIEQETHYSFFELDQSSYHDTVRYVEELSKISLVFVGGQC